MLFHTDPVCTLLIIALSFVVSRCVIWKIQQYLESSQNSCVRFQIFLIWQFVLRPFSEPNIKVRALKRHCIFKKKKKKPKKLVIMKINQVSVRTEKTIVNIYHYKHTVLTLAISTSSYFKQYFPSVLNPTASHTNRINQSGLPY